MGSGVGSRQTKGNGRAARAHSRCSLRRFSRYRLLPWGPWPQGPRRGARGRPHTTLRRDGGGDRPRDANRTGFLRRESTHRLRYKPGPADGCLRAVTRTEGARTAQAPWRACLHGRRHIARKPPVTPSPGGWLPAPRDLPFRRNGLESTHFCRFRPRFHPLLGPPATDRPDSTHFPRSPPPASANTLSLPIVRGIGSAGWTCPGSPPTS